MPVTVKVNGTANSLVHKGSNGISAATLPDVCKTPSPGGPVPIPYPNISQSISLAKGTTTVKADGGMMIAIKGSEFSLSNGDNAGVAGGVKSSTFMKESTWILYSFDVKMDGKNACRLTDKKFQNHQNTVDLAGDIQNPVVAAAFEAELCKIVKDCEHRVNQHYCNGPPSRSYCRSKTASGDSGALFLGNEKDKCVKDELNRRNDAGDPAIPDGMSTPEYPIAPVAVPGGGNCYPDIMFGNAPNCDAVYDIKTKCPPDGRPPQWPTYRHGLSGADRAMLQVRRAPNANYDGCTQADIYRDACGVEPKMIHPYSDDCQ